ncbi:MAG TPA: TonB family protein [Patescibacteria group bacterium]|nr:TonB family protein [Patescibacteria group bacterium]
MKKRIFSYFILICSFVLLPLPAETPGDILLQLRFYEGVRGPKPAEARVVTAYTLRPLFIGNFTTWKGLQDEEVELKRVFNLKDLAALVQTQWSWERDKTEKRFQMVVLNGHEFLLQIVKQPAADAFRVQVIDQGAKEKPALLDSEIVLPAGKVSVFGFEDSLSQPYFLAVQRQPEAAAIKGSDLQMVPIPETRPVPKLLKKVDPVYPEKMLQSGKTASVTLEIGVNEGGKVWSVKAFSRESEFVKAAVDAITQWTVEPLVVDGKAQPQTFTFTVNFLRGGVALDFSGQKPLNASEEALYRKIRGLCEPRLGQKYKAQKITLRFQEEPVAIAAQILTKVCGIPVQADPVLREKMNCNLRDMPWDQAMARLLDMHGLDIAAAGNGLNILSQFQLIWPTAGYIWSRSEKRPDGTIAALVRKTGKMYYLSSGFGKRLNPYTKKEEFHPGIDILAKKGAPVLSAASGTVTASEFNEQDGNRIVIDHGNGYTSAYHHLDSREVKVGDNVTKGQLIGKVGSSGVSTGPHLHFEIRCDNDPRNPFDFIGPAGK